MVDIRDPLAALWAARSIAVVGASERPGTPGRQVLDHLTRFGYSGTVVPVNPRAETVLGRPAQPKVPAGTELALILVPAAAVAQAVRDCAEVGVAVAIVGSSGFAETGPAGRAMQAELVRLAGAAGIGAAGVGAAEVGVAGVGAARVGAVEVGATRPAGAMRLVGPNCIGAVGFHSGLVATFSPLFAGPQTELVAGGTGFASASGALGYGTVSLALARGLGLFAAVTTGNEADVTALEALAAMARDPGCTALLGYLESLADGPALRELAAVSAASGKPVALLVAGGSPAGARAAASHTGALATADRVVDGVLRQYGIARARDVDELLDFGAAFQSRRPGGTRGAATTSAGARVAVVTTSGGSGILATDAVDAAGLTLATFEQSTVDILRTAVPDFGSVANPVDVTATVLRDRTLVARCLDAVAADPGVDAIVLCFCVLVGDDVKAVVEAVGRIRGKPVVVARTGAEHLAPTAEAELRAVGVPVLLTPARAVRALAALLAARGRHHGPAPTPTAPPPAGEAALKAALAAHGVRVPRGRVVADAESAPAAVSEAGGRAVLKVVVPGALHKTELAGVRLDVAPESAGKVAAELLSIPGATGVLVEEQVDAGVEVLVGVAPSPLGPIVTIGAGGVLAEALDDAVVRLLPVGDADIRDAIGRTRLGRLLAGFRGRPPSDVDALVWTVRRVVEIAGGWGGTLDLNPVIVNEHGAFVVDAALEGFDHAG